MPDQDPPLMFRDRKTLETQQRLRNEIKQTLTAFSIVLKGEGGGKPLDEGKRVQLTQTAEDLKQLYQSLPRTPLTSERVHTIERALTAVKSMTWLALSKEQQVQLFSDDVSIAPSGKE